MKRNESQRSWRDAELGLVGWVHVFFVKAVPVFVLVMEAGEEGEKEGLHGLFDDG